MWVRIDVGVDGNQRHLETRWMFMNCRYEFLPRFFCIRSSGINRVEGKSGVVLAGRASGRKLGV